MTNAEFAQALRRVADYFECNPEVRMPDYPSLYLFCREREEFLSALKGLTKAGTVVKSVSHDYSTPEYHATVDFGGVKLRASIQRSLICRLVSPAVYDCPDSLLEEAKEYERSETALPGDIEAA